MRVRNTTYFWRRYGSGIMATIIFIIGMFFGILIGVLIGRGIVKKEDGKTIETVNSVTSVTDIKDFEEDEINNDEQTMIHEQTEEVTINNLDEPYKEDSVKQKIRTASEKYNVPYALALAVADVESGFNQDAVSSGGDVGIFQINPCNHEWLLEKGMDVYTEDGNIEAGCYLIGYLLDRYAGEEYAVICYNAGEGMASALYEQGTYSTNYSKKVMEKYDMYQDLIE